MRLVSVDIKNFRNIIDSGHVNIDSNVTCLVGKNESGKTAFLHALYRLYPARPNVNFSVPDQYPAWLEKKDRLKGLELDRVRPVTATYELDVDDIAALSEKFGEGIVASNAKLTLDRDYGGTLWYTLEVSEEAFVKHIVASVTWPHGTKTDANKIKTIKALREYVSNTESNTDDEEEESAAINVRIEEVLKETLGENNLSEAVWASLKDRVPQFLYFSEYSSLPYSVRIDRLLQQDPAQLNDGELTARSLLKLAAADNDFLANPDYERRKRELENVSNAITQDVLQYWSQNPELRVQPDITQETVSDNNGKHSVLNELKMRIWDQRHQLSLPFDEHSTGFQWFFSFLAAFSEYEYKDESLVILLDEPALGLHARAQGDFLKFIEVRLASKNQVLYTTHSPFMVQPGRLERVRLVEDKGQTEGTKVTSDVTTTDPDTLFPLQGALGYDLAQHLFIAPHNLVVEGTSDYTYLQVLSDHFKTIKTRTALDEKWSLVPVGGIDLVPTFVALLGNHLDVTVLIDSRRGGHQKLSKLADQGILEANRILTIGHSLGRKEADIEDLFDASEYLELFNAAFGTQIKQADIKGSDPIVRKLARAMGKDRFDHGRPADYFLRTRDKVIPRLSDMTLDRFETLFEAINATLPSA
ncbi:MAG: AAA family ATPase [Gammaproteobacteria bacterium]